MPNNSSIPAPVILRGQSGYDGNSLLAPLTPKDFFPNFDVDPSTQEGGVDPNVPTNIVRASGSPTADYNPATLFNAQDKRGLMYYPTTLTKIFYPVDPPPIVDAGENFTLVATLSGSVTGTVSFSTSYTWSKVSGPSTVSFGTPNALTSTITLGAYGIYRLRLTSTNGVVVVTDDVYVVATAALTTPITPDRGWFYADEWDAIKSNNDPITVLNSYASAFSQWVSNAPGAPSSWQPKFKKNAGTNGKSFVRFDRTAGTQVVFLTNAPLGAATKVRTAFVVCRLRKPTEMNSVYGGASGGDPSTPSPLVGFNEQSDGVHFLSSQQTLVNGNYNDGDLAIVSMCVNDASSYLSINGVQVNGTLTATNQAASTDAGGLWDGATWPGGDRTSTPNISGVPAVLDFYEAMIFTTVLNPTDRATVESYLSEKYALPH